MQEKGLLTGNMAGASTATAESMKSKLDYLPALRYQVAYMLSTKCCHRAQSPHSLHWVISVHACANHAEEVCMVLARQSGPS